MHDTCLQNIYQMLQSDIRIKSKFLTDFHDLSFSSLSLYSYLTPLSALLQTSSPDCTPDQTEHPSLLLLGFQHVFLSKTHSSQVGGLPFGSQPSITFSEEGFPILPLKPGQSGWKALLWVLQHLNPSSYHSVL